MAYPSSVKVNSKK